MALPSSSYVLVLTRVLPMDFVPISFTSTLSRSFSHLLLYCVFKSQPSPFLALSLPSLAPVPFPSLSLPLHRYNGGSAVPSASQWAPPKEGLLVRHTFNGLFKIFYLYYFSWFNSKWVMKRSGIIHASISALTHI